MTQRARCLVNVNFHSSIELNGPVKVYRQRSVPIHTAVWDLFTMEHLFTTPLGWNTILFLLQLLSSSAQRYLKLALIWFWSSNNFFFINPISVLKFPVYNELKYMHLTHLNYMITYVSTQDLNSYVKIYKMWVLD